LYTRGWKLCEYCVQISISGRFFYAQSDNFVSIECKNVKIDTSYNERVSLIVAQNFYWGTFELNFGTSLLGQLLNSVEEGDTLPGQLEESIESEQKGNGN
jgi:hypothetical protein